MKNNLPTAAGQSELSSDSRSQQEQLVDAINQIFALFKLNYHNQFFKAYGQAQDLNSAKRLWLDSLQNFSPEVILRGAKAVLRTSEFLPTLHTMLKQCEAQSLNGLPDAHSAYIEACRAPSPKVNYPWSHPAVYHAGRKVDWYFLQNHSEQQAFPVFKQAYQEFCDKVRNGEQLPMPNSKQLPTQAEVTINREASAENIERLKALFD